MVRLGTPDDVQNFFYTDDAELILRLHQAGHQPVWKDEGCLYFKKTNKLLKSLKKLNINVD